MEEMSICKLQMAVDIGFGNLAEEVLKQHDRKYLITRMVKKLAI